MSIQQLNSELDANELKSITEPFITLLNNLPHDANQCQFTYRGDTYILTNCDNDTLEIKNDQGVVLSRSEQFSLKQLGSRLTALCLFQQLDPATQTTFLALFDIKNIGQINVKSPIVSGDLDGSIMRQIVLTIQSGHIRTTLACIESIARIMNAESLVLYAINEIRKAKGQLDEETAQKIVQIIKQGGQVMPEDVENLFNSKPTALEKLAIIKGVEEQILFSGFQANEDIQNRLEELTQQLTFDLGHTPLVMIGDCAHDRFSNNKDVDRWIREALKQFGVIFILGNHDVFLKKECTNETTEQNFIWAFGCFAKDSATDKQWEKHQKAVFVHAYYDELTNRLYLHHGLGEIIIKNDTRMLSTAFGFYPLPKEDKRFDPVKFVRAINHQLVPRPEGLLTTEEEKLANAQFHDNFTGYRKSTQIMEATSDELEVNIGHGHDGVMTLTSNKVMGFNPRENGLYTVWAARIGLPETSQTTINVITTKDKKHKLDDPDDQSKAKKQRTGIATSNVI